MKNIAILSDYNGYNTEHMFTNYNEFLARKYTTSVYSYIRDLDGLKKVLRVIYKKSDVIAFAIINKDLASFIERFAIKHNIKYINLYEKYSSIVDDSFQFTDYDYTLDKEYFSKIDCIEYAINNDDGKSYKNFDKADIIILGISRTGKTPLSMYLALRGYKVANIPLYNGMKLPDELASINKNKIFGLINSVENLCDIRTKRIGHSKSFYTKRDEIVKELNFAYSVYDKYSCDIIYTDNIAVEEIAHYIETKIKENC